MENTKFTPPPKKKNPLLKGLGCLLVVGAVSVIAFVLVGIFRGGGDKPKDPRKEMLEQDIDKTSMNPPDEDSISNFLKPCIEVSIKGIKTDEIRYYTRINGNKLLVLLKVGDMKGVEKSTRKILVEGVEDCLSVYELPENVNETYIGVDGNWNMLMVKTPHASDLGGKFADKDLLLPFYDGLEKTGGEKTITTDSAAGK